MALCDGAVLMEKGGMDRESEREREKRAKHRKDLVGKSFSSA